MLDRRGLVAAIAGVISLAFGVAGWAGNASGRFPALVAGLAGVVAGALALWSAYETRLSQAATEQPTPAPEPPASNQRAETMLSEERRARADAEARVELLETSIADLERRASGPADLRDDAEAPKTRPVVDSVGPEALTDAATGLFTEAYFRVALDARIASARRHLRPVAVGLLHVVDGVGTDRVGATDPAGVSEVVRETLRDADTACRLDDGSFALILEDTPENGAVWTVERIRRALSTNHPQSTLWAGVACYPAHAFSTDELLDQGRVALDAAREWSQDRIEVATADVRLRRATLAARYVAPHANSSPEPSARPLEVVGSRHYLTLRLQSVGVLVYGRRQFDGWSTRWTKSKAWASSSCSCSGSW